MNKPIAPISADQFKVLSMISYERDRQLTKWGLQSHVDPIWNSILGEEVGEVSRALCESFHRVGFYKEDDPVLLDELTAELVQVAAVATAWVECILRRRRGEC